ncbi:PEP-CTERM sorting domain-containing protein [Aeoliella sp.]|uniref:PEP-CTERM sorting domain-containing protein n=1 Tax=Aeoliella sp. TaxID=2795800 RepID=UPI003CCBDA50
MARNLLVALVLIGLSSSAVAEEAPDVLDLLPRYHLLPRHSYVQQSGDDLERDILWRARGSYGFMATQLTIYPAPPPRASFYNPEIWGTIVSGGPAITLALDVDSKFNLDGLRGTLVPTLRPYGDLYHFTGFAEDNLAVDLYALQQGNWMYLKGTSYTTTDFGPYEEYNIRALARTRPWADLNDDGRVNIADYVMMRNHQGSDLDALTLGDAEGVTMADWKSQFGETMPSMDDFDATMASAISSMSALAVAIPEPTSVGLLLAGALGLLIRRRYSN